ncbi:MAG: uracil phosphoribosyltransferase [Lentimicrobiaceae bacterium]|jgi:uracil phosphoribosyltransferase
MVINLGSKNSVLNQFVLELRDASIQKDSMRFRRNMERIGEIFAYEISKTMQYNPKEVITSLGTAEVQVMKTPPVLATILRAGLPLHQGILNYFDNADNAFVSAYREHRKDDEFSIQIEYVSSPDLENRVLILTDPMLATGQSMVASYKSLLVHGKPAHTHFVSVVASIQGVEYLKRMLPKTGTSIWIAAIDDELTAQGYIVPGLGDAGDLAYGQKI